jgi:hypothetical protein
LAVDGTLVYNDFIDQGFASRPRVLMDLKATVVFYLIIMRTEATTESLDLHWYESNLATNAQSVCVGNAGSAISGDVYGTFRWV